VRPGLADGGAWVGYEKDLAGYIRAAPVPDPSEGSELVDRENLANAVAGLAGVNPKTQAQKRSHLFDDVNNALTNANDDCGTGPDSTNPFGGFGS
jgi:hypothetical protein